MGEQISRYTIRTSGRRVFRRCLRKWGFQSSMRMNLQRKGTETNINFWFGSAIHFAMEDYFGYNRFGDPRRAFQAYYAAFPEYDRPEGASDHYYLGLGMLDYFMEWYPKHNQEHQFETVWLDEKGAEVPVGTEGARPLVEESFMLNLGLNAWAEEESGNLVFDGPSFFSAQESGKVLYDDAVGKHYIIRQEQVAVGGIALNEDVAVWEQEAPLAWEDIKVYIVEVPIMYHGTMDRIVRDRQGRWWILDYKTAKSADTNKLDTDDQISAYMWAAEQWFQRPIHGFVYMQLTKEVPKAPKRLQDGSLSVDKKQKTTYQLLRKEILKEYGEVKKAPKKIIDFLNTLASLEGPEGDRFIRWDMVTRNKAQKESTYYHILGEARMMINPDLYLFPNPTRDCSWDCPFREACLMMDRGEKEQVQAWIDADFEQRPREEDGNIEDWKKRVPWPDESNPVSTLLPDLNAELEAAQTLNIILPDKYSLDE